MPDRMSGKDATILAVISQLKVGLDSIAEDLIQQADSPTTQERAREIREEKRTRPVSVATLGS